MYHLKERSLGIAPFLIHNTFDSASSILNSTELAACFFLAVLPESRRTAPANHGEFANGGEAK
jgi:hypothetical protein